MSYYDINPMDIDPDTGRPYSNYSSPSLDTSFYDGESDVDPDTFDRLTADYDAWLRGQCLPARDAGELIHEDITPAQRAWLSRFIQRWDAVDEDMA